MIFFSFFANEKIIQNVWLNERIYIVYVLLSGDYKIF